MFFIFKCGSHAADVKVCPVGGMSSGCGFMVLAVAVQDNLLSPEHPPGGAK